MRGVALGLLAVTVVGGAGCGTEVDRANEGPGGTADAGRQSGRPDGGVLSGIPDAAPGGGPADGGYPDRPYTLHVPPSYDGTQAVPLVMLLHGYSATGELQDLYLGLSSVSDKQGFLLALPNGLVDPTGLHFWNATDACCDFYGNPVNDVAYLRWVMADVKAKYKVDPNRVWLFGHSNGAFMSHRLACDATGDISAIVALSGDQWLDWSKCNPSRPISVLQIHGTADIVISYNGGTAFPGAGQYPSARGSIESWAHFNGCPGALQTRGTLDLDSILAGSETTVELFSGCPAGIDVELWSIQGGSHVPAWTSNAMDTIYGWMTRHPKI